MERSEKNSRYKYEQEANAPRSFRLTEELSEKLDQLAKERNMSPSEVIRDLLQKAKFKQ